MMPEINAHETQEGLSGQQEVIKNKNGNHYATWV
jgi:hypothetical protein